MIWFSAKIRSHAFKQWILLFLMKRFYWLIIGIVVTCHSIRDISKKFKLTGKPEIVKGLRILALCMQIMHNYAKLTLEKRLNQLISSFKPASICSIFYLDYSRKWNAMVGHRLSPQLFPLVRAAIWGRSDLILLNFCRLQTWTCFNKKVVQKS